MSTGGWKTPFPIRFGGRAHESVEDAYESLRANVGDAMTDDDDSASDAEIQATARLLSHADSYLEAFANQSDPRALSSLLSRWETILAVQPSVNDSNATRRARVASRLLTAYTASSEGIDAIAREAFYPWRTRAHYLDASDAVMYWPGGNSHPDYDWYSTTAYILVEYELPTGASAESAASRWAVCKRALDEFAPAWTTFDYTETQSTGTYAGVLGFYLGQPNLDVSVL
jgi:hypothetical protein